jgi:hypothetical protein
MDVSALHQILWGVGIFFIGVLAGYMLKVVLVNLIWTAKMIIFSVQAI